MDHNWDSSSFKKAYKWLNLYFIPKFQSSLISIHQLSNLSRINRISMHVNACCDKLNLFFSAHYLYDTTLTY